MVVFGGWVGWGLQFTGVCTPSLKLTIRTWKLMLRRLLSFRDGLFSGAIIVLGSVILPILEKYKCMAILRDFPYNHATTTGNCPGTIHNWFVWVTSWPRLFAVYIGNYTTQWYRGYPIHHTDPTNQSAYSNVMSGFWTLLIWDSPFGMIAKYRSYPQELTVRSGFQEFEVCVNPFWICKKWRVGPFFLSSLSF